MVKNCIKVFARLKKEDESHQLAKYYISRRNNDHEDICFPANSTTDATHKNHKYRFTKVFEQSSTQVDIFNNLAKPIINSAINGFNGTIFAYGQTGSGKTYSITGSPHEYNDRGILPRSIEAIFETTKTTPNHYNIYVSYLEIYNEVGYDLLNSKNQPSRLEELPRVVLLEDANGETHLRNLSVLPVTTEQEAMRLLFLGDTNRSERISKAKINGVTLKEAKHINLSLHYLEQVILALSQSNRTHIPYRNSMMTYILRDSLSGNSLTYMLSNMSLNQKNFPETLTTCRFAQRVACISTEAIINEEVDPQQEIEFLRGEVNELSRQIVQLKGVNSDRTLTLDDQEKCRKLVVTFAKGNGDCIPEDLDIHELKYCLKVLREQMTAKALAKPNRQEVEEEMKTKFEATYSEIIRQKDEEISVLTQLLESTPQKLDEGTRVRSAPVSSQNPFPQLKSRLAVTEHELFDAFMEKKDNFDDIVHIQSTLNRKYELARNISDTVQKCQANIGDIKRKLHEKFINAEITHKLHNFLISQQKIYRESLEQLRNLKGETDFLKESLKQAENKLLRKFKASISKNEWYFIPRRDSCLNDYRRRIKTADESHYCGVSKRNSFKTNPNDYMEFVHKKTNDKLAFKTFSSTLNQLSSKKLDEIPSDGTGTASYSFNSDINRSDEVALFDNLEQFAMSSTSRTSSFEELFATPRSEKSINILRQEPNESHETTVDPNTESNNMESLYRPSDSPAFVEFMKTIPLTGDPEVDDEIFNFYRSKFEQ